MLTFRRSFKGKIALEMQMIRRTYEYEYFICEVALISFYKQSAMVGEGIKIR